MVNKLASFEINADQDLFIEIFGEWMGNHLWGEFIRYDHKILSLWRNLNDKNKSKLLNFLKQ